MPVALDRRGLQVVEVVVHHGDVVAVDEYTRAIGPTGERVVGGDVETLDGQVVAVHRVETVGGRRAPRLSLEGDRHARCAGVLRLHPLRVKARQHVDCITCRGRVCGVLHRQPGGGSAAGVAVARQRVALVDVIDLRHGARRGACRQAESTAQQRQGCQQWGNEARGFSLDCSSGHLFRPFSRKDRSFRVTLNAISSLSG